MKPVTHYELQDYEVQDDKQLQYPNRVWEDHCKPQANRQVPERLATKKFTSKLAAKLQML